MKKIFLSLAVTLFFASTASADFVANTQNPNAPLAASINTVAKAKAAPDDSFCVLQGKIVNMVKPKYYTFTDDTGTITVKISSKIFAGVTVTPNNTVLIQGEVDKDFSEPIKIDVKYIEVVK